MANAEQWILRSYYYSGGRAWRCWLDIDPSYLFQLASEKDCTLYLNPTSPMLTTWFGFVKPTTSWTVYLSNGIPVRVFEPK